MGALLLFCAIESGFGRASKRDELHVDSKKSYSTAILNSAKTNQEKTMLMY
jgi:hypothetical protein